MSCKEDVVDDDWLCSAWMPAAIVRALDSPPQSLVWAMIHSLNHHSSSSFASWIVSNS